MSTRNSLPFIMSYHSFSGRKMGTAQFSVVVRSLVLSTLLFVVAACESDPTPTATPEGTTSETAAETATATETAATSGTATVTETAATSETAAETATTSEATSDSSFSPALQKVIEGAKEEGGVVNVRLQTGATAASVKRLEDEIFKWSGVRLTINNLNLTEPLAQAVLEREAGVQPTFDMAVDTTQAAVEGVEAGAFDVIDWKSILIEGTPEEVVYERQPYGQIAIMQSSTSGIWIYNPEHVDGATIKTWADVNRPEWNGRVGIPPYTSFYARAAYIAGKDKIFPAVAGMIKNGAFIGNYSELQERYRLGELWIMKSSDSDQSELEGQGIAAKWLVLDFVDEDMRVYIMPKNPPHPNSAKLLAVYIASPAGAKWMFEEHGASNFLYAGGLAAKIRARGQELGVPVVQRWADPGLLKFQASEEYKSWRNEVRDIIRAN